MRTLIVSDTHHNIELYKSVLESSKADVLFHLGDYYEDSERAKFSNYCQTLYRVPGIYHPGYRNRTLPAIEKLEISGIDVILVHDIEDVNFANIRNSIIFYGHSHTHKVSKHESNILINPGHLKELVDRQQLASYLILTQQPNELTIEWHQVQNGLIKTYKIMKNKDNTLELKL